MKKLRFIHPVLFAAYPVVAIYAGNIREIPPGELVLPLLILAAVAMGLLFAVNFFVGSLTISRLIVSPFMLLVLSYGRIYDFIGYVLHGSRWHLLALTAVTVMALVFYSLFCFLVVRFRNSGKTALADSFFPVLIGVLILVNLYGIACYAAKQPQDAQPFAVARNLPAPGQAALSPDIYYIILDAYATPDTVKRLYHYDNNGFVDYLREKGFYVASKSKTQFTETKTSLAASLNMDDKIKVVDNDGSGSIDSFIASSLEVEDAKDAVYEHMMRKNAVLQFLKFRGYRYIQFGSWFYGTRYNRNADVMFNCFGFRLKHELSTLILGSSFVRVFLIRRAFHRESILYEFTNIRNIIGNKGPKFVFAHIICPHPPYVFGRNGESIAIKGSHDPSNYLGQYIFVTNKVKVLVDQIISESKNPPIIVIQSDHGIAGNRASKTSILNAYFLPDGDNRILWPSISPVNTFRVIFNHYFHAGYELLGD